MERFSNVLCVISYYYGLIKARHRHLTNKFKWSTMEERFLRRFARYFLRQRRVPGETSRGIGDTRRPGEVWKEPKVVSGNRRRMQACGTRSEKIKTNWEL